MVQVDEALFLYGWFGRRPVLERYLSEHAVIPINKEIFLANWEKARHSVLSRPQYSPPSPAEIVAPVPLEAQPIQEALLGRHDFIRDFAGRQCIIILLDITHIIVTQLAVFGPPCVQVSAASGLAELWEYAFPHPQPFQLTPVDADRRSITFISNDINLRCHGAFVNWFSERFYLGPGLYLDRHSQGGAQGDDGEHSQSELGYGGFALGYGCPLIYAAQFGDRYFLLNGHHRCVAALRNGVRWLPAVLYQAKSRIEIGRDHDLEFTNEAIWGDSPPMLADFLDPAVAAVLQWPRRRRAVRLSVDTFYVP